MSLMDGLADRGAAARLLRVYAAATDAMAGTAELDLSRFEIASDDLADLSVWEELAPTLMRMVTDMNALVATAREQAGAPSADPVSHAALKAVGEALGPLTAEIVKLGEVIRSPAIVSDRWALLTELQGARARFRQLISDLVFGSVVPLGATSRSEVVPGWAAEVKTVVAMRAIGADFRRLLLARRKQFNEATREDLQWNAQQLAREVKGFASTVAYRSLRAQDKRPLVELQVVLDQVAADTLPDPVEIERLIDALIQWTDGLAQMNKRQILIDHDREVWANAGVALERAEMACTPQAVAGIAGIAMSLYGRDGNLDAFLRKARKTPWNQLSPEQCRALLDELRELIANLPVHED
jgi:hypothetical protein